MKKIIHLTLVVIALAPAILGAAETSAPTPDPNDMYCENWDSAHKTLFLDKQQGATFTDGGPGSSQFVFYETPAHHDHGLPTGSCGVRLVIYQKTASGSPTQTGRWEDLNVGMTFGIIEGPHHCYFRVMGGGDEDNAPFIDENYIIDDAGNITATKLPGSVDQAVWVTQGGQELFWEWLGDQIALITPEGKTLWSKPDNSETWHRCFSMEKFFAFSLSQDPAKGSVGTIYSQDGKDIWKFPLPFNEVKAHKEILGFDSQDRLILRVDRNIYRVDHEGKPVLAAVWPLYHRRHNYLETTGASHDYDVDSVYSAGVTHAYEFATNVEMKSDHPRPRLEFNIDNFEARESLDEGKTWHPVSMKP